MRTPRETPSVFKADYELAEKLDALGNDWFSMASDDEGRAEGNLLVWSARRLRSRTLQAESQYLRREKK